MPSTSSSSFCSDLPSSTVITPSLPTFSMASAMIFPTSLSRLAEIDPICATSLDELQGREIFFSSSTTAVTALSMPRLRSIGYCPTPPCATTTTAHGRLPAPQADHHHPRPHPKPLVVPSGSD